MSDAIYYYTLDAFNGKIIPNSIIFKASYDDMIQALCESIDSKDWDRYVIEPIDCMEWISTSKILRVGMSIYSPFTYNQLAIERTGVTVDGQVLRNISPRPPVYGMVRKREKA